MKNVTYIPFNTTPYHSPDKIMEREVGKWLSDREMTNKNVAIKVHFGEDGSTRFIRSLYCRRIADAVKRKRGNPFCTDTNVLYPGKRQTSTTHLELASMHGYNIATLNCPVIIADGLLGKDMREVECEGDYFTSIPVASAIAEADYLIVVTHVTFHGFSGVGSAVKNIGMGCVSMEGKRRIHMATVPKVYDERCIGCKRCLERCRFEALQCVDKIKIDYSKCTGCGHCMGVCFPQGVFENVEEQYERFNKMLADVALSVIKDKQVLYINLLTDITSQCDCASFTHPPVCSDKGIVISDNLLWVEQETLKLIDDGRNALSMNKLPYVTIERLKKTGNFAEHVYEVETRKEIT